MVRAKVNHKKVLDDVGEPPSSLGPREIVVTVLKARGNNQYDVKVPRSEALRLGLGNVKDIDEKDQDQKDLEILVIMPAKFRNTVFVKRGGYAVVELFEAADGAELESKVKGELTNIVYNSKDWQRMPYWPEEYKPEEKKLSSVYDLISDEEEESELVDQEDQNEESGEI